MKGKGENAVYIALYVDDLFMVGVKLVNIQEVKEGLSKEFKMKDLGEAKFLLGIEIRRQEGGDVLLVQERYARDVLSRFSMVGCKVLSTPMELGCHLALSQQPVTDVDINQMVDIPYRSAIGSLMYLSTCIRPDIAAAVSELSKFSQNPGVAHWEGVKRVFTICEWDCRRGLAVQEGSSGRSMGIFRFRSCRG